MCKTVFKIFETVNNSGRLGITSNGLKTKAIE